MFGYYRQWQRKRLLNQIHHVATQAFAGPVVWTDSGVRRQIARDAAFVESELDSKKMERLFPSAGDKTILFTRYLTEVILRGDLFRSLACPESVVCAVSRSAVDCATVAFYKSATRVMCWFPNRDISQRYFPGIPSLALHLPELDVNAATLCPDRRGALLKTMQRFARCVPERHVPALKCCIEKLSASVK